MRKTIVPARSFAARMTRIAGLTLGLAGLAPGIAGPGGCSREPESAGTAPESPPFTHTLRVRSGQVGTIRNDRGVTLTIFANTVPRAPDGGPGEILFGVHPAAHAALPPRGYGFPEEEWSFEPAETALAGPCRISMPVPDTTVSHVLARWDEEAGVWRTAPTVVDPARTGRAAVDVVRLGAWALLRSAVGAPDPAAVGRVRFRNVDSTRAVHLSILESSLLEPAEHMDFDPAASCAVVAGAGRSGGAGDLASEIEILLPPGTYVFQATRSSRLPSLGGAAPDGWIALAPVRVERPGGAAGGTITLDPSAWEYVNASPPWSRAQVAARDADR